MIVTQENLIKQIANREDINVATVRKIFESAEKIVFDYLSSTTSSENMTVKLMDGLSLECNYIPEKEIHTYDDIVCKPRVWAKPKITRYYNRKLNGYFDRKENLSSILFCHLQDLRTVVLLHKFFALNVAIG